MKLTLKRDLPLLLAALLVIWGFGTPGPSVWTPCIRSWSRTSFM